MSPGRADDGRAIRCRPVRVMVSPTPNVLSAMDLVP